MLTMMLTGSSVRLINTGSELNFADSDDGLQKGMVKFAQLRPPQND
jgi:hypothetical protein